MIKTNADYFKIKDTTIVEFGHGTIHFTIGVNEGDGILACKSGEPGKELGERFQEDMTIEEWKPDLLLKFTNIESLDLLIKDLSMLKSYMKMDQSECKICNDEGLKQSGTIMIECDCKKKLPIQIYQI